MTKVEDDMYLIVPASNVKSCQLEVDHIEERAKLADLVIRSKSRHSVIEPPPAVHQRRVAQRTQCDN